MQSRDQMAVQWTHFLLRVVAGAVLMQHGAQKLFGVLGSAHAAHIGLTLPGIAGPLEFIGGLLIVFGLFTRPVAFVLAGEMAVVYFLMHFPHAFWPVVNHGEVPILLCFIFLYLAARGAGTMSLDHLRTRRRPSAIMR